MEKELTLDQFMEQYDKRIGKSSEEKLFCFLDYSIRDESFNQQTHVRANDAKIRLAKVNSILKKADEKELESNIYLKKCKEFLDNTKDLCTDILLSYHKNNDFVIIKEISTDCLLPSIDDKELQSLDIVSDYNSISTKIERMYLEICRLQIWNLINISNSVDDDIATVFFHKINGNLNYLVAVFQEKFNKNLYTHRIHK